MSRFPELIAQIEKEESTRLITYVLADRLQGPQASIATDALGLFHRHLEAIGEVEKISLFLYSTGGDTMVPWRLVNLMREYCKRLVVIVPYKAHSAATLICLGADEIVMGKMSELSPIDPSVANAFNPSLAGGQAAPQAATQKIPISVEDVAAYFRLAAQMGGLTTSEGKLGAFQQLASVVHPLALGNVERSHTLIRELARKLLGLHIDLGKEEGQNRCTQIVNTLTEKLYSHQHLIPRREARDIIGLDVRYASKQLERLMMDLYQEYRRELGIGEFMNPAVLLDNRNELPVEWPIAKIQTLATEDKFVLKGKIVRNPQPNQAPLVNIMDQGWEPVK